VVPVAGTVADQVRAWAAGLQQPVHVIEDEAGKLDAMKASTVALACSGTVTTELALAGTPMVVGYRLGAVTYAILRRLIRTPWVTLLNVAAKAFVVPELIQDRCTGPNLAAEIAKRLDDPVFRQAQIAAQTAALDSMGPRDGDPAERAADAVLALLRDRSA
jgi:lipid-A-disaccharide synthase